MRFLLLFLLTALLLLPMVPVEAHHSASSFWHTDRTTVIEGVVKSVTSSIHILKYCRSDRSQWREIRLVPQRQWQRQRLDTLRLDGRYAPGWHGSQG